MHEGEWSAKLGIPGRPGARRSRRSWPATSRWRKLTGGRYHVLHLSTGASAELVRAAKAEGIRVTCEVSPQHLALTDAACASFDPVFKMNPPLRSDADVAAVTAGLADGTIDAIATDHAPHAPETKERPFEEAPPGMLGVETALAVAITKLVDPGVMTLAAGARRAVVAPGAHRRARRARPRARRSRPGNPANLCVLDPAEQWVVDPDRLASRSRNTPFAGWKLTGRVRHTVLRGQPDRPRPRGPSMSEAQRDAKRC